MGPAAHRGPRRSETLPAHVAMFRAASPMNLGAWTLTAYSGASALAVAREWLRRLRQGVLVGMVLQQKERVQPGHSRPASRRRRGRLGRRRGRAKLLDPPLRPFPQLVDRAELDRLRGAGLGAGRRQAVVLTVVAERAFVGVAVVGRSVDHAEGAGGDAVAAAVADIRLHVNVAELVVDERAGRAGLLAGGVDRSACRRRSSSASGGPADRIRSHRNCSMNLTCRQVVADRSPVLS